MNKTTNYQLNQWDATDRIKRTDFNADNAAVDSALTALSTRVGNAETVINALSSSALKIATGSYGADNTYGSEYAVTLNFDFTPQLVIVQRLAGAGAFSNSDCRNYNTFILVRPLKTFFVDGGSNKVTVKWGDQSVKWYSLISSAEQLNIFPDTYIYLAIG